MAFDSRAASRNRFTRILLRGLSSLLPLLSGVGQLVYINNFESPVGTEWSLTNRDVTPFGARTFLGQFGNQTNTLTLTNLPPHTEAELAFDLFIIRSWDGTSGAGAYELWTV